jgi:hypothetical protein
VGAAKTTTARERSGNVAAHSSATMPPSDPPVASATRRTPSASTSSLMSRAWSRVPTRGELAGESAPRAYVVP